jgi:holin-like protein
MLEYLTLILICQLIGEFVVNTASLPFPGPVVGMLLLFLFLMINGEVAEPLAQVSDALLGNLSLLFVPAGVGVMLHFDLLDGNAWPLLIALVISTLLTIAVTAKVMLRLNRRNPVDQTGNGQE